MGIRPKLFLIFLLGLAPMLALGWVLYWNGVSSVEAVLRADVERDAAGIARAVESGTRQREAGMMALARSQVLRNYVRAAQAKPEANNSESENLQPPSKAATPEAIPPEVRAEVRAFLLSKPKCYSSITCLNAAHKPLFRAEPVLREDGQPEVQFQTELFLSSAVSTEKEVWETNAQTPVRANSASSSTMRYMIPVFTGEEGKPAPRGALIAELNGDELLGEAVVSQADETQTGAGGADSSAPRFIIMLDRAGHILYHTHVALRHQQVNSVRPAFANVSAAMMALESGQRFYEGEGALWLVSYRPVAASSGLSVGVGGNHTAAVAGARRLGWIAIILFAVFGLLLAFVLTHVARGTARSIERVTEGAVAIAGGKLDQRIEVRSSDETRLLAESFNIMTDRLREQIARETESRQFESFMRLSAMLTHDLKNAIASLSLLVANMQKQFHREEFREDAMKSLTEATNKLRSLVSKLSEPVQSLSSEHQLPRPTDLTKIIRRVLDATVEPVRTMHEIEIQLPDTLVATVEADRIEKVFENLVINALEAMGAKSGKLRVEAGPTPHGEVYFLVSDTGPGMSEEFKRTKLFRAFATTKRSGVGLGLYTCREIVRTHGGHIDVESKRGSGTTFRVVLPSEQNFMGRTSHELSKRQ